MVSDNITISVIFLLTSLKCGIAKRNRRLTEKSDRDNRQGLAGEVLWPYREVSPCGCKVCPWPLLELQITAVLMKTLLEQIL